MAQNYPLATLLFLTLALSHSSAEQVPKKGLILWLDASNPNGTRKPKNSPTKRIAKWLDKSGQGNHFIQPHIPTQPTWEKNALAGKPAVRFHGRNSLHRLQASGLAKGDQAFHAIFVMRAAMHSAHPNPRLLDFHSADPGKKPRHGFWIGYQGNGRNRLGITHGNEGEAKAIAWNNKPALLEVIYHGAQKWQQSFNGQLDGEGFYTDRPFLGFEKTIHLSLGQHFGITPTNTYYKGDLAEVLLYNRPLTSREQNALGAYLTQKYSLPTPYGPEPRFEKEIRPLIASKCLRCHSDKRRRGGLELQTVTAMLKGGGSGPVLVPGYPERSEMLRLIEKQKMPPEEKGHLSPKQTALIRRWIALGAPAKEKVTRPDPQNLISSKDRQHWAYQHLQRPPIPRPARTKGRNPIDTFVLQKLSDNQLSQSPPADKELLARRASLDLLGLPLDPDVRSHFLSDNRPGAYERLLDQLLSLPHFGEHWGRQWLDAAGYVDVYGSDNDAATINTLPGRWRYRDYVVQSYNQNKPLDRFITEQLAGDELYPWQSATSLTPEMREALIATGFLLSAADDTQAPELNTPDIRHQVLQKTAEIVASNLLGLTLQCAKCHNHKYEAIPQQDYYRFLGIFAPAFNPEKWLTAKQHAIQKKDTLQVVYEKHSPSPTFLLWRGNHEKPVLEVQPGLLSVLSDDKKDAEQIKPLDKSSGRRTAMAKRLTNGNDRAGALMARVMVNRIWQHLFGRGIVATSDNLGVSGAKPTHPELLEWLASELVANQWHLKPVIRLIMTSATYRQSSARLNADREEQIDPENRLLWKIPLRRIQSETVRDAILKVGGNLSSQIGGKPVPLSPLPSGKVVLQTKGLPPSAKGRRSIYVLARRNYHLSLLSTFDQPTVATNCSRRTSSAVVTQPLTLLNDDFVLQQAGAFAKRVMQKSKSVQPGDLIELAFQTALSRSPNPKETKWCSDLFTGVPKRSRLESLTRLCHLILNLNEFLYIP